MTIAPLGIFCLIAKTFSSQGIESIFELLKILSWCCDCSTYSPSYCLSSFN